MKNKVRRQPPIPGGRTPLPSTVLHSIEERIRIIAKNYNVSRSWVIAVILADALGITDQVSYEMTYPKRRKRRGK